VGRESKMEKKITRRSFLGKTGLAAAAGISMGIPGIARAEPRVPQETQAPRDDTAYRQKMKTNIMNAQRCARMFGTPTTRIPSATYVQMNDGTVLVNQKLNVNRTSSIPSQIAEAITKEYENYGKEIQNVYAT
jgi:hypothetical protein